MALDEVIISKAIIEIFSEKLLKATNVDVAIVGGGPSGLIAAYYLASAGKQVVLFEKKLSPGGGMWGGGMMFNEIVIQAEAKEILDQMDIRTSPYGDGYYMADAVETTSTLCSKAARAGATIFNCMSVEDVMIREGRVTGLVINWSPVEMAGLHVDPMTIAARCVVDATGHSTAVLKVIERKGGVQLNTPSGKIIGERSMWVEKAEQMTLEKTCEICPGVYVAGMSVNAAFGGPRMGPIFGGMLLSGRKVADLIMASS